jgi:D-amino peptidase
MNVYMSIDIEGVAGIAGWNQVLAGQVDYAHGRALMAGETNAAIEGALAAGAQRIVVNDAHAGMTNLLAEAINPRARLVLGRYKPLYMLEGLDASFDAAFFIGYHGAIGAPEAILCHSYNPSVVWEAKVDGRVVGEIGINAMVCEYFGVPIRLVSGDQATALEAREVVPSVHVAEVKRSFSRYSAENLSPEESRAVIRSEAEACLNALPTLEPSRTPVAVEITFTLADMAGMAEWVRGVERTGPRTVCFTGSDGMEAYRTFYTVLTLTKTLVD